MSNISATSSKIRSHGKLRSLEGRDIAALKKLFIKTFDVVDADVLKNFEDYVSRVFLSEGEEQKSDSDKLSMVFAEPDETVSAGLFNLAMPFRVKDRIIQGKLGCAWVSDPNLPPRGAAQLALTMRASRQDLIFTDTGSAMTAELTLAGAGQVLPVQSLSWTLKFRPASYLLRKLRRRGFRLTAHLLSPLTNMIDRRLVATRWWSAYGCDDPATDVRPISTEDFRTAAIKMMQRFDVHPHWDKAIFDKLIGFTRLNPKLGNLFTVAVDNADGRPIGVAMYFRDAGDAARVFHLIPEQGHDRTVARALLKHLQSEGCIVANGMAQPYMIQAFAGIKGLSYAHRGHFCVLSKHQDVMNAVMTGRFYAGGLASESWSRFVCDGL